MGKIKNQEVRVSWSCARGRCASQGSRRSSWAEGRWELSTASMREIMAAASSLMSPDLSYSPLKILRQRILSLMPRKGKQPCRSLYMTTPTAQMSAACPVQPPLEMISGEMQWGVPQKSQWMSLSVVLNPKSISLICMSRDMRMFSSLMSRCTMFLPCRQARATRISLTITRASSSLSFLSGWARRQSSRELFSTISITMLMDSGVQTASQYLTMLGWLICSMTLISLWMLLICDGSDILDFSQIFMAKMPPFHPFTMRTVAQEPFPITPPTLYVPTSSAVWFRMFCSDLMRSRRCDEVCLARVLLILGNPSAFSSSPAVASWEVNLGMTLFLLREFSLSFSRLRNFFCLSSSSQRLVLRMVFLRLGSLTGRPNSIPKAPLPREYSVRMWGSSFGLSPSQPFSIITYYLQLISLILSGQHGPASVSHFPRSRFYPSISALLIWHRIRGYRQGQPSRLFWIDLNKGEYRKHSTLGLCRRDCQLQITGLHGTGRSLGIVLDQHSRRNAQGWELEPIVSETVLGAINRKPAAGYNKIKARHERRLLRVRPQHPEQAGQHRQPHHRVHRRRGPAAGGLGLHRRAQGHGPDDGGRAHRALLHHDHAQDQANQVLVPAPQPMIIIPYFLSQLQTIIYFARRVSLLYESLRATDRRLQYRPVLAAAWLKYLPGQYKFKYHPQGSIYYYIGQTLSQLGRITRSPAGPAMPENKRLPMVKLFLYPLLGAVAYAAYCYHQEQHQKRVSRQSTHLKYMQELQNILQAATNVADVRRVYELMARHVGTVIIDPASREEKVLDHSVDRHIEPGALLTSFFNIRTDFGVNVFNQRCEKKSGNFVLGVWQNVTEVVIPELRVPDRLVKIAQDSIKGRSSRCRDIAQERASRLERGYLEQYIECIEKTEASSVRLERQLDLLRKVARHQLPH